MDNIEPRKLYHYCSLENLIKIIENHSLRFSDVLKANDTKELALFWKYYPEYVKKNGKNPYASIFIKSETDATIKNIDFLTVCFSKDPDSLHMWKTYGDKGANIGFLRKDLEQWAETMLPLFDYVELGNKHEINSENSVVDFRQVDYETEDGMVQFLDQSLNNSEFVTDSFLPILRKASITKSAFWKIEKEWRIVLQIFKRDETADRKNSLDQCNPINKQEQKYKIKTSINKAGLLYTYCDIAFPIEYIKSITLAPNCLATVNDIEKLLIRNNYGEELIKRISNSKGSLS